MPLSITFAPGEARYWEKPRRILVTGSRDWTDRLAVLEVLRVELNKSPIIVVHGDCTTGADAFAQEFCDRFWDIGAAGVEKHPAEWGQCRPECYHKPRYRRDGVLYCPAAGNFRNQEMVDLGAVVCHAFPLEQSRGTWHCMKAAEKAGIPVVNHGFQKASPVRRGRRGASSDIVLFDELSSGEES